MQSPQQLPYGMADYTAIVREGMAFVDKTQHIPLLESAGKFLFFLRPRRFGKSLTRSLLQCYYDINFSDQFQELFSATWIGQHPTPEKNQYLVLPFDFSLVKSDPAGVEASFERYAALVFDDFAKRYPKHLDPEITRELSSKGDAAGTLNALFLYAARKGLKLYVIIDEYDNFTNTILSLPDKGTKAYQQITHGDGFFREFFKTLKGGAGGTQSGLARLLITGVSPVTMDDVTSGFNIGIPISLRQQVDKLVGFTRAQVLQMVQQQNTCEILNMPPDDLLDLLETWYGGYRFSKSENEILFNSDMILYFLRKVRAENEMPFDMIDHNVRIDYTKLRHLVVAGRKLNGNFTRLKSIIDQGYTHTRLVTGFPLEDLTLEKNFISLLYYFGLLTIRGVSRGQTLLVIPNKTIEKLMVGYIRDAMEENGVFQTSTLQVEEHLTAMGWDGQWKPFFQHMACALEKQTGVRDYIQGERMLQGFLLAWLNLSNHFQITSERELNKGFCDLYLEPMTATYKDIKYGYLIELKYIKRGEWSQAKQDKLIAEAREQLTQYRQDPRLDKAGESITWICAVVVFHGWELTAMTSL